MLKQSGLFAGGFAVMVAAGIVRGLFWIRRGSNCKAGRCVYVCLTL